jgi:hypothetical protein
MGCSLRLDYSINGEAPQSTDAVIEDAPNQIRPPPQAGSAWPPEAGLAEELFPVLTVFRRDLGQEQSRRPPWEMTRPWRPTWTSEIRDRSG